MGGGSIRADRAVNPTLVFNETYDDFVAAGTDALQRIDLNLPSIDAPTFLGSISTSRTAINVSGQNQVLSVNVSEPAGVDISVGKNNGNLNVKAGDSITFPITIDAPAIAPGQYFARITLVPQKPGATPVTIPVAFVKKATAAGTVSLTHTCQPTTFPVGSVSHCTVSVGNVAQVPANVNVQVSGSPGLQYSNVSAPASLVAPHFGATWSGTLSPAIPPQVTAINTITGQGPAGGYLPIAGFGGITIPGGDDAITNVNVPTFYYGGETYSSIGVVTNGYVVIGGGTASDVNFFPQTFPNKARPNNVVAPFWTDLNTTSGTGGGKIVVNVLTDGDSDWIIVDFEGVKNFSNSTTHTGEVWIRASTKNHTGPAGEQITVSYGAANAAAGDPGSAMNWGAENRDGTSGKNLPAAPADGSEWRPVLTGPTPGGSATFTYDASADTAKTYTSTASMTSDVTPGTSQAVQTLTVTP
jgi:Fibronectin type-III domain